MSWFDNFFWKKVPKADFIQAYEALFSKPIPNLRPISELTFVVMDTETTGFDPKIDHVVSFGAIKLKGYRIQVASSLETYLDAPHQNTKALEVHEILYPVHTLPLNDFAKNLLEYVRMDIIVGHHIGFDLRMLEKELKPFGLKKFLNPVIDTKYLAMRLEKGPHFDHNNATKEEYSLDAVCQRFGIPLDDRHTAAGDAFLTAQLLMKLLKLAESKGIKDYGGLAR